MTKYEKLLFFCTKCASAGSIEVCSLVVFMGSSNSHSLQRLFLLCLELVLYMYLQHIQTKCTCNLLNELAKWCCFCISSCLVMTSNSLLTAELYVLLVRSDWSHFSLILPGFSFDISFLCLLRDMSTLIWVISKNILASTTCILCFHSLPLNSLVNYKQGQIKHAEPSGPTS